MFRFAVACSVALAVAVGSAVHADVVLKPKFHPQSKAKQRVQMNLQQVMTINGMDINTSVNNSVTTAVNIGEKGATGTLPVKMTIEAVQSNVEFPGGSIQYDSSNPQAGDSNPLTEVYRAITGATLTYQVDDTGKAIFVEGAQDVLNSTSEQASQLLKHSLNQENLATEFNQETSRFPTKPIKQGDTWKRTEKSFIGGGQTLTFDVEYQYQGTVTKDGKTFDRITSSAYSVTYSQADDAPGPAKVTQSDLKVKDWKGEILFDREKGITKHRKISGRITGDMNISINGQDIPANLDLKISTTSDLESSS